MDVTINSDQKLFPQKAAPMAREKATEPRPASFAQIFKQVSRPDTVIKAEPATLTRLIKPHSHLKLTRLNPTNVIHKPQSAALERTTESRILPFALSNH